ncbi:MAG: FeoA family protein [Planctomycetota bacterium]
MSSRSSEARRQATWLSSVAAGQRVRVVGLDAGRGLSAHLAAMGLVPGVEVLMVRNQGAGPALIEVKGTRLALGRGMAAKIRVE